jgi:hypothetical protein
LAWRVSLAAPAEKDAYAAFERIREAAPMHADKWLTRLFDAILSLDQFPARCPVIPEAKELGYQARHLLYGKGRRRALILPDFCCRIHGENNPLTLVHRDGDWGQTTAASSVSSYRSKLPILVPNVHETHPGPDDTQRES